jgi:hypothetical protein
MATNDGEEYAAPRRVRWEHIFLLFLCLIAVAAVLVWQIASHTGNSITGGRSTAVETASGTAGISHPLTPPVPLTAMYDEIVKNQVAEGLHLTVAQVTAQLQAEPTPDLRRVSKGQNLAQDQLYRLVRSALQTADDRMVSNHAWTQQQADEETQYWSQQAELPLINGVASWFL